MAETERVQRPFWMHQIVEYLVGLALIAVSFQNPKPAVPAILGALIVLNAALTVGPAGAFRLLHRKVHKWIDIVLMVALLVMSVQWWADVDLAGRFTLFGICLVMAFVWFHTDFSEASERRRARRTADGAPAERATSEEIGRAAGRYAGQGYNALKRLRDRSDAEGDDVT